MIPMHAYSPLLGIHMFFCALLSVGVVLLIIWAAKYLKKEALKKLSITLIVLGLVGAMLTAGRGWPFGGGYRDTMRMPGSNMPILRERGAGGTPRMMEEMMDDGMEEMMEEVIGEQE